MLFESCVRTKHKFSEKMMTQCCLVTLHIAFLLKMEFKCSLYIQAEIHKMTSHCYCVNFTSTSMVLLPLTRLWKVLEWSKMGFEIMIWYYNRHQEKKKKVISDFLTWTSLMDPGDMVASWLVCSTPEQVVPVRALSGDIVLCSCNWARQITLTVPLSTQGWVVQSPIKLTQG